MAFYVILAAHNRVALTERCLTEIHAVAHEGLDIKSILFDDGSTDGTQERVERLGLGTQVIRGDGDTFWARSMAIAESRAILQAVPGDWLVWVNDDVDFDRDWLERALPLLADRPSDIHVGAMRDPQSGQVTYSGFNWGSQFRLRFQLVSPSNAPQRVQTFNGNLVFVPSAIATRLGGIDGKFSHAWADLDYGLRAGRAQIGVWLLPGTYGECSRNNAPSAGKLSRRWRAFTAPKGAGNPASLVRFLRRHGSTAWPLTFLGIYAKWFYRAISSNEATES